MFGSFQRLSLEALIILGVNWRDKPFARNQLDETRYLYE